MRAANGALPLVASLLLSAGVAHGEQLDMLYMAQAGYQPSDILERADSFEEERGIAVELSFVEYEEQYDLILESSGKPVADYDVILVDLIWTAEFAEEEIIDPVPPELREEVEGGIIPEIYSAFFYNDVLWAMPFLANFQLLYTNVALLEEAGFSRPPGTLEELVDYAAEAKRREVLEYPIFLPLRRQEALICVFVWLTGAFGGDLVDAEGRIDVTQEAPTEALQFLRRLLDEGLLNPYSLEQEEVFAAEVFAWGDSLFTVNWTFLEERVAEVEGATEEDMRASLIPLSEAYAAGGGRSSTVSGYQGLSVPRNSNHKGEAWEFIRYLASPEFQRDHPSEMPVWKDVWGDDDLTEAGSGIRLKREQLAGARHRPIHPDYRAVSDRLQYWIHRSLRGDAEPSVALRNAQAEIDRLVD